MWPFFTVPWVGLQCVIVVFPGHTHLLFEIVSKPLQQVTIESCSVSFRAKLLTHIAKDSTDLFGFIKCFAERIIYTEQQKERIFCIFGIMYKLGLNIGINHGFEYINIRRVPRKVY